MIRLRYILVAVWVVFTLSLTGWWVYFGVSQVELLHDLGHGAATDVVRYQKMWLWEGAFLFLFLIAGGVALVYYMYREVQESKRAREFFAVFSHELKTPLASVVLQAEILKEELAKTGNASLPDRFLGDISKLTLQLENSLVLAEQGSLKLHIEKLSLAEQISRLSPRFPTLKIEYPQGVFVEGDSRALESLFSNLFQNSLTHGQASQIRIYARSVGDRKVEFKISDNGKGFSGQGATLAKPFFRHYSGSGSGLGLYLAKTLAKKMGGELRFLPDSPGFHLALVLRGEIK